MALSGGKKNTKIIHVSPQTRFILSYSAIFVHANRNKIGRYGTRTVFNTFKISVMHRVFVFSYFVLNSWVFDFHLKNNTTKH